MQGVAVGGIQFLTDVKGTKTAAVIDLKTHKALWEDIADVLVSRSRRSEKGVSLEKVKEHFAKYGLLDDQVRFLEGWFKDTLPKAPIDRLAILRLDGDMYESTMDAISSLYPKLSKGGFLIIDDYGAVEACRKAITDYRAQHKINDAILQTDSHEFYWRKG